jgi:hypothetical protein
MNNGGDIAWASMLIIIVAQEIKNSYFIAHLKGYRNNIKHVRLIAI